MYVENVEEEIISKSIYMCNLYRSVKGSLHHDLLVSEVKNIWIFNRRFDVHEKLFSEQKANGIKVNKTFRDREETTT